MVGPLFFVLTINSLGGNKNMLEGANCFSEKTKKSDNPQLDSSAFLRKLKNLILEVVEFRGPVLTS